VSVLQGDVGIYERSFRAAGDGAVSVALDPMEILYSGSLCCCSRKSARRGFKLRA